MEKSNLGARLKQWFQKEYRVLLAAACVTTSIICLSFLGLFQIWEFRALDLLFALTPSEIEKEIVLIVEARETDLQNIGQWPIPDAVLTKLVNKLNQYQPRAIGLDIYRNLPVNPGYKDFGEIQQKISNLVGIEKLASRDSASVPPPPLLERKNQVGFNNVLVDTDGKVRRSLLYGYSEGKLHRSFSLQLALIYLHKLGIEPQRAAINSDYLQLGKGIFFPFPSHEGYQIIANFNYSTHFEKVSITEVLEDKVDPSLIKDRLILIGSTAPSLQDFFQIPPTTNSIPGVELHGRFVNQIVNTALGKSSSIRVGFNWFKWLWILCWSIFSAGLVWYEKPANSFYLNVLTIIITWGFCNYLLFLVGWWLPVITTLISLLGAAFLSRTYKSYKQKELRHSKEFLKTVINTIPDPVFVRARQDSWLIFNQAFYEFSGYSVEKLLNSKNYDTFPDDEAEVFNHQDSLVFQTHQPQEHEEYFTDEKGKTHLIATKRSIYQDGAGNIFLVGVIRDITERKRIEKKLKKITSELIRSNSELQLSATRLRKIAYHDSLTGLANRQLFLESLSQSLQWGAINNHLVAVFFLDLDGFKQVNDSLGHDVGDLLLKAVAQRLTSCLRNSDLVARLGGDEFTVILPGIKQTEDAQLVAQKILATIAEPFLLNSHQVSITTSIGISIYPHDGEDMDILLKKADLAMYQSKESGSNQYQLFKQCQLQRQKLG